MAHLEGNCRSHGIDGQKLSCLHRSWLSFSKEWQPQLSDYLLWELWFQNVRSGHSVFPASFLMIRTLCCFLGQGSNWGHRLLSLKSTVSSMKTCFGYITNDDDNINIRVFVYHFRVYILLLYMLSTFSIDFILMFTIF